MYLPENKNHIISQLPKLSPEEKEEVKRYFNAHANLENQVDWNKSNWGNLTFEYFIQNFINKQSKRAKKKAVKASGINGLTEGEDYLLVYQGEYTKENGDTGIIEGYVPLSWESSRVIASKNVGSDRVEGEWCIAWQKSSEYWDYYSSISFFVIFVDYHDRGPSTNELDWGKETVQFKITREFSLKGDIFTYGKDYAAWNRYDNKPEKPYPTNISYYIFDLIKSSHRWNSRLYTINEVLDINDFAEKVANMIKKSRGINRVTKTMTIKPCVMSFDSGVLYVIITSKLGIGINPVSKGTGEFVGITYNAVYFELFDTGEFGIGLIIRDLDNYMPLSVPTAWIRGMDANFAMFPQKDQDIMMNQVFPEGNIYQLSELKNAIKKMIGTTKIDFVVYYQPFRSGKDGIELQDMYIELLGNPIQYHWKSNRYFLTMINQSLFENPRIHILHTLIGGLSSFIGEDYKGIGEYLSNKKLNNDHYIYGLS